MKKFKPFDKILYRINKRQSWTPSFYQYEDCFCHFVIGVSSHIKDENILPYEGNENLVDTIDEPEEEITLAVGELVLLSTRISYLKEGKGLILNYGRITESIIVATNGPEYPYCIPMSKYNSENLEETGKWILTVKNGKLVKVNK